MRNITYCVALLLAGLAADVSAAIGVAPYVDCSKPGMISVVVKNTSATAVEVPESSLPWNYSSKVLVLRAFRVVSGRRAVPLREHRPIADYFAKKVIRPGQTLAGEISLAHLFVDYDEARKSGDLIVFYDVNGTSHQYIGHSGVIFIPMDRLLARGCPSVISKPMARRMQ